jgi:hypothetical protein
MSTRSQAQFRHRHADVKQAPASAATRCEAAQETRAGIVMLFGRVTSGQR